MAACCHEDHCSSNQAPPPRYRKALWAALVINALMFVVELSGGMRADSVSLLADSIDFLGDAANYGIALAVLGMLPVWRSRAALLKGLSMAGFGLFVLARTAWQFSHGVTPEALTMGSIGALALLANVAVALMLYAFRDGDANMRSVWLCSRNDALGNLAVMIAAAGVFGTGSAWPDWLVALAMGALALSAGISVCRLAMRELGAQANTSLSA